MNTLSVHWIDIAVGLGILLVVSWADYSWFFFTKGEKRSFQHLMYTFTGFGVGWFLVLAVVFIAQDALKLYGWWFVLTAILSGISAIYNGVTYPLWRIFFSKRYYKILYRIAAIWAEIFHQSTR